MGVNTTGAVLLVVVGVEPIFPWTAGVGSSGSIVSASSGVFTVSVAIVPNNVLVRKCPRSQFLSHLALGPNPNQVMATSRTRSDELTRVKREEYGSDEGAHFDDGDDEEPEMGRLEYLVRAVIAGVKHYLPQLVLVAILIPWLLVVSLVAGWLVKSSVPVGVEERIFMRYG